MYKSYTIRLFENGKEIFLISVNAKNRGTALSRWAKVICEKASDENKEYLISLSPFYPRPRLRVNNEVADQL